MIRRFGEPVVPGQRYGLRHGVYAVLIRGGDALITFQESPDAEFQLPGGGIDPGESPLRALHREVFEETGWAITGLRRLGAYRRFTYMPEYDRWAEKLCTVFAARPTRRLSAPTEAGHTALWLPADEALALLTNAGDRHFMAAAARG